MTLRELLQLAESIITAAPLADTTRYAYRLAIRQASASQHPALNLNVEALSSETIKDWGAALGFSRAKTAHLRNALQFTARQTGAPLPHISAVSIRPGQKIERIFIDPKSLEGLRRKPPEFFGKQYPLRYRAIVLLELDTLATLQQLRDLRFSDVAKTQITFRGPNPERYNMAIPKSTLKAVWEFVQWRIGKYGHPGAEAPLFQANRGGEALKETGFRKIFCRVIEQLGYPRLPGGEGLRTFRICAARNLYAQGANLDRLCLLYGLNAGQHEEFKQRIMVDRKLEAMRAASLERINILQSRR